MNDEKGFTGEDQENAAHEGVEDKRKLSSASRARNRTVMLTPEMTGQVRALLHRDPGEEPTDAQASSAGDPLENLLPPLMEWEGAGGDEGSETQPAVDSPGREEYGAEEERSSTGKYGRQEVDQALGMGQGQDWQESAFDPMSSANSLVDQNIGQMQEQVSMESEARSVVESAGKSSQPSFSVNRSVASREAGPGSGRAPRTPGEAGARIAPVSTSAAKSKIIGFLISFDKDRFGEVFELRSGRWLLTSRPTDHGDYILINDESISPLHAIVRATKDGKIQVLDQLSEYGTAVCRAGEEEETEIAGGLETVDHGDTVRFGRRYFVVCTVPKVASVAEGDEEETEE